MTALQRCCSNGTVRQQIWKVVVLSLVETYPDLIFLMYDFFIWIFIDYIKRLHRLKEKLAWTIKILFSPKNPFWIPTVEKCERECDAGENRRYSQNREHHRRDEHHDQLQLLEGLPRFENGRFKADHYFCTRCVTSLLSICSSCEIFYTFQSRVLLKSTTCVKILHYRIMYKVWSISLERSLSLIGIVIAIILLQNTNTVSSSLNANRKFLCSLCGNPAAARRSVAVRSADGLHRFSAAAAHFRAADRRLLPRNRYPYLRYTGNSLILLVIA